MEDYFGKENSHARKVAEIIDTHSIHIFAEIGVWKFKMGKKLLISPSVNRTIKEYWAIDPYCEMPQYATRKIDQVMHKMGQIPQNSWNRIYQGACKYLLWFHQVKLLRLNSEQASKLFQIFETPYFDMVFIDADHTDDAVKKDITLWKPLVRKGGILSGHDYGIIPEVTKAVDELIPNAIIFPECYVWMTYV